MDWLNDARIVITVFSFICFIAICFWAWGKPARRGFDEAAMIPFRENDHPDADKYQH